jgi:hypothetical protein
MSKRLYSHRRAGLLGSVIVALALAGSSYAYFSSHGLGHGSAAADSVQPLTVSPGAPSQELYPGGASDVALTLSNPNKSQLTVPALALDTSQGSGGFGVDQAHADAGCSAAAAQLGFDIQTINETVPARTGPVDGTLDLDLTQALSMGAGATDACQGASFTVYLKVATS